MAKVLSVSMLGKKADIMPPSTTHIERLSHRTLSENLIQFHWRCVSRPRSSKSDRLSADSSLCVARISLLIQQPCNDWRRMSDRHATSACTPVCRPLLQTSPIQCDISFRASETYKHDEEAVMREQQGFVTHCVAANSHVSEPRS